MSNMLQVVATLAVPGAFFMTCRYLNLRSDQAVITARSAGHVGRG